MEQERLLRLPEVLRNTGPSRSEWYRLMDEGLAPRPIAIGRRSVAWKNSDIQRWIAERNAAGYKSYPKPASKTPTGKAATPEAA